MMRGSRHGNGSYLPVAHKLCFFLFSKAGKFKTSIVRGPHNKQLTNLANSSRTRKYWPLRLSCPVTKRLKLLFSLLFCCLLSTYQINTEKYFFKTKLLTKHICRYPGTTTKAVNLASYNYLGFAENSGPCAESAEHAVREFGIAGCSSRHEYGE